MGPSNKQRFGIFLIFLGSIIGLLSSNDFTLWAGACTSIVGVLFVYLGGTPDDYHTGRS